MTAKRSRPDKGFYSYLNSVSTVDIVEAHTSTVNKQVRRPRLLQLDLSSVPDGPLELPEGVFQVERVIHQRKSKVSTHHACFTMPATSTVAV